MSTGGQEAPPYTHHHHQGGQRRFWQDHPGPDPGDLVEGALEQQETTQHKGPAGEGIRFFGQLLTA